MLPLQLCRRAACALALALWPAQAAAQDAPPLAVQQALNRVAVDLFSTSPQPAAAIEELKGILADYPELAEAHMLLGFAYRAQGATQTLTDVGAINRQFKVREPQPQ